MAMAEEGGIIAWLFERNCKELLQEIFLYLDPESLHNSRQTCQWWNDFIRESVWGSKRGHRALERKLHNNWLTSPPRVFSVNYTGNPYNYFDYFYDSDSALALDNKYLVAGLKNYDEEEGGAKVIDLATQEIVAHLPHRPSQDEEDDGGVWCVMITQSWIITQGRQEAFLWSRDTFQKVLKLDLPVEEFEMHRTLISMETDGGQLYLAHYKPSCSWNPEENCWNPTLLSLYKLNTDTEDQEFSLELISDRKRGRSSKFGNNKDTPVLVTRKVPPPPDINYVLNFYPEVFLIDQLDGTEREARTDLGVLRDYSFSSPHLVVLSQDSFFLDDEDDEEDEDDEDLVRDVRHKLVLRVWNVESSPLPLYFIDIDEVDIGRILLEDNLIRVSMPGKFCVLDATTIEDRKSVRKSRREITKGDDVDDDAGILFNKFLGVCKWQDIIQYYNFWR